MNMEFNPIKTFDAECKNEISQQGRDTKLSQISKKWLVQSSMHKYSYHFSWMGRPIIQLPQDIVALQEIIWTTKPDIIIETGIAHGGSLCLNASMLSLLDLADLKKPSKQSSKPKITRKVIGVDIDIRKHNKNALDSHPMADKITMIEGSSIEKSIFEKIKKLIPSDSKVLVILDSNHTENHVLEELRLYTELVTVDSYCIVCDTIVAQMAEGFYKNRPWGINNNPKGAVEKFLKESPSFIIDDEIDAKLLLSMSPKGYLRRIT